MHSSTGIAAEDTCIASVARVRYCSFVGHYHHHLANFSYNIVVDGSQCRLQAHNVECWCHYAVGRGGTTNGWSQIETVAMSNYWIDLSGDMDIVVVCLWLWLWLSAVVVGGVYSAFVVYL